MKYYKYLFVILTMIYNLLFLITSLLISICCWILNVISKVDGNGLGWCHSKQWRKNENNEAPKIMSKFTSRTGVDDVVLVASLRENLRNLAEWCPREIKWNAKCVKLNFFLVKKISENILYIVSLHRILFEENATYSTVYRV